MIFTWDNLFHAVAAAALVFLLHHFMGAWGLPVAIAIGFFAREMEQRPEDRWRPWRWSAHKHFEWIVPSAVALAVFAIL